MSGMKIQIYSECDAWCIQVIEGNDVKATWRWDHNESHLGSGGERLVYDIFEFLGYDVYYEEVA